MTTRMRSLRNFRNPIGCLILLAALGAAAGCSTAENPNGSGTNMNHVLPSGSSVAGWLVVPSGGSHASTATQDYIATGGGSGCTECHGSDLSGGISGTSCFSNPAGCHHQPVVGWVASPPGVQNHGVSAKKAPGSSGFASCQICHGRDFSGGGAKVSCLNNAFCHDAGVLSPHPARPWRGSPYTHTNTDTANAPVCYQCHAYTGTANPNNPHVPPSPASAGTAPGCFNGTMCHNEATPHPLGSPAWYATPPAAQPHGSVDNGAKGAPGSTTGFLYCQACHGTGTDFAGGSSGVSCTNSPNAACHGPAVASPHPPTPWRGSPYTHATTNPGNASVCANCHRNANPGTPDCFNNTLCHAQPGAPHPVGSPAWYATPPGAQQHGSVDNGAKGAPGSTTGFLYCQTCHGTGTDFAGGSSGVSCTNSPNAACHGPAVASPHPPTPWRGSPYTHATTNPGNASVCANCHRNANPGTPDCFNNTLCHAQPGAVPHPVGSPAWYATPPAAQPHGSVANGAKGAPGPTTGFAYCRNCHGTGTDFAGGSSGVSCTNSPNAACHGPAVASPHPPTPWRGSPYTHATTNTGNASVCANCHRNANPGTPGCFNNTLCHAVPGTAAHSVPFDNSTHYSVTSGTFTANCGGCHDVSAPSTKSGPVCQTCHVVDSPLTAAPCTSCHANPPNGGAGAAYANIAGAHAVHIALNGTGSPVSCDTCHNGLGTNTLNHYNRAKSRVAPGDAAFLATYNAQSGASSFNATAFSCSNVSCHGGQATPNWQTGTLNVNTQCTNCHTDGTTTQFNGPTSTNHNRGPHQSAACTACHNTTALEANHFTNLSTPALEGPASATIGGGTTSIPAGNYNAGSCTPSCHGNETW